MSPRFAASRALLGALSMALACMLAPLADAQSPRAAPQPIADAPEAEPVASPGETRMCEVQLRNLPATLLRAGEHELRFSDGRPRQPVPESGVVQVRVEGFLYVQLLGPTYRGHVELDAASCASQSPALLHASPRPARLRFQTSLALDQLVVDCLEGCHHREDRRPLPADPPRHRPARAHHQARVQGCRTALADGDASGHPWRKPRPRRSRSDRMHAHRVLALSREGHDACCPMTTPCSPLA